MFGKLFSKLGLRDAPPTSAPRVEKGPQAAPAATLRESFADRVRGLLNPKAATLGLGALALAACTTPGSQPTSVDAGASLAATVSAAASSTPAAGVDAKGGSKKEAAANVDVEKFQESGVYGINYRGTDGNSSAFQKYVDSLPRELVKLKADLRTVAAGTKIDLAKSADPEIKKAYEAFHTFQEISFNAAAPEAKKSFSSTQAFEDFKAQHPDEARTLGIAMLKAMEHNSLQKGEFVNGRFISVFIQDVIQAENFLKGGKISETDFDKVAFRSQQARDFFESIAHLAMRDMVVPVSGYKMPTEVKADPTNSESRTLNIDFSDPNGKNTHPVVADFANMEKHFPTLYAYLKSVFVDLQGGKLTLNAEDLEGRVDEIIKELDRRVNALEAEDKAKGTDHKDIISGIRWCLGEGAKKGNFKKYVVDKGFDGYLPVRKLISLLEGIPRTIKTPGGVALPSAAELEREGEELERKERKGEVQPPVKPGDPQQGYLHLPNSAPEGDIPTPGTFLGVNRQYAGLYDKSIVEQTGESREAIRGSQVQRAEARAKEIEREVLYGSGKRSQANVAQDIAAWHFDNKNAARKTAVASFDAAATTLETQFQASITPEASDEVPVYIDDERGEEVLADNYVPSAVADNQGSGTDEDPYVLTDDEIEVIA